MMPAVILFDGVCNFCNSSVNFIIDRDPDNYFKFAALQSEQGKRVLGEHTIDASELDTIILLRDGKVYERSTAALHIARKLRGAWKLFYAFIIVPAPLRDIAYRYVAKNRYKWFGKKEACRIPTPEERARFIL